jgi:hypothetical protein
MMSRIVASLFAAVAFLYLASTARAACDLDVANAPSITMAQLEANIEEELACLDAAIGAGVSDGDKGDITVSSSGSVYNIDAGVIGATEIATDGVSADELNATGVESELEAVIDLSELQGDLALGTQSSGNFVGTVADGTGIDGTASGEGATYTPTLDLTEVSSGTWGAGSFTAFTFDAGAVDPVFTFGSGTLTFSGLAQINLDDEGEFRFFEEDAGGANYKGFKAPAAVTANTTCTFEDDANFIPDSCVGDGTDSAFADGDKGDITVSSSGTVLDIDSGVVGTAEIATDGVDSAEIAANAVANSEMADNAIANAEMADNAVGNAEMADNAVGNAEMADNAVGQAEVADDAIGINELDLVDGDVPDNGDCVTYSTDSGGSYKAIPCPGAGGGISNVSEDVDPELGGALDTAGFAIEFGNNQTDTSMVRSAAGIVSVEGVDLVTLSATQTLTNKSIVATQITAGALNIGNNAATVGTVEMANGTANTLSASSGDLSIEGNALYRAGGTDVAVADGGTGVSSLTAYAPLFGGTTSTGAVQSGTVGTAGQVLTSNGAGALPTFQAPAGSWTLVNKGSDTTRNTNTTTSADPTLQFSLAASTTYAIRCTIKYTTPDAADLKVGLSGPASPTEVYGAWMGSATTVATSGYAAYPTNIAVTQGSDGMRMLLTELVVENGANTNTFSFDWAQNTSNAGPTTVKAGSYCEYRTY